MEDLVTVGYNIDYDFFRKPIEVEAHLNSEGTIDFTILGKDKDEELVELKIANLVLNDITFDHELGVYSPTININFRSVPGQAIKDAFTFQSI